VDRPQTQYARSGELAIAYQAYGFITGADRPEGVAVDAAHIYWTNGVPAGTIGRSDLNGENPVQSFIIGTNYRFRLAVDAANIHWTNAGTNTIGRANLDGGSPNPSFISGPNDSMGSRSTAGTSTGANTAGRERRSDGPGSPAI
jgi:virginiamycin B lyase